MTHSSVPHWPTTDPGVDPAGRSFAVVSFGEAAAATAEGWCRRIRELGRPVWSWHARTTAEGLAALGAEVATARVGWRLLLAGPQLDVLAARAVAVEGGALAAEITILVTDDRRRRVWCPHCRASTDAEVAIGTVAGCSGCGRMLRVQAHVSRRSAAYLGVADAGPTGRPPAGGRR